MPELLSSDTFHIYTDGSCLPTKRGAWAYRILKNEDVYAEAYGVFRTTTSVRMELQAAISGLRSLPVNASCILFTDSRIIIDIAQRNIPIWKANDWKRSKGQHVIDLDLIEQLDALICLHLIEWRWVRAHSGIVQNEYCDQLCRKALLHP